MKLKVVLIDDHEIVLQGLRLYLQGQAGVQVVGEASNATDAVKCVSENQPDLVFLDMELAGSSGIVLARQILQDHPKTKILIFSGFLTPQYVQDAIQAGVSGYLNKTHKVGEIEAALQAVRNGEVYLCAEAATALARDYRKKAAAEADRLTAREVDILKRIADGESTKEIASELRLSVKTVETHRQKLMQKFGVRSVAELTKCAIRQGLSRL
jgi:DNA-binding NarL/FixJ family response regulator